MSSLVEGAMREVLKPRGGEFPDRGADEEPPFPHDAANARLLAWLGVFSWFGLALFALYLSWLPFDFDAGAFTDDRPLILSRLQQGSGVLSRVDLGVNATYYIVIGMAGALAAGIGRSGPLGAIFRGIAVVLACGSLSLIAELGQVWLPSRIPSLVDIGANSLGSFLGCLIWAACGAGWERSLSSALRATTGLARLDLVLQLYLVLHVFLCLYPLAPILSLEELGEKVRNGQIELRPAVGIVEDSRLLLDAMVQMFVQVPVGVLCTRWRMSQHRLRSISESLLLGIAIVAGIEVLQIFIAGRYCMVGHVLVGSTGILAGVLLTHGIGRTWSGSTGADSPLSPTWLVLSGVSLAVPACYLLWPFEFTSDTELIKQQIRNTNLLPFNTLSATSSRNAAKFVELMVLQFPLGVCLGLVFPLRRRFLRWLIAAGILVAVSLALELVQVALPGRTVDLTQAMCLSAGGLIGLLLSGWISHAWRP